MAGLLSGLWKGLFGSRQDELNEQATEESIFQMQHPFARTMQDAQQYGINPITALGSQPNQATFSGSSESSTPGQLLNMIPAIIQASASRSNTKDNNDTTKENNKDNNATTLKALQEQIALEKEKHAKDLQFQQDKWEDEKKLLYKQIDDLNQRLDWQQKHGTVIGAPEKIAIADTALTAGKTVVNSATNSVSTGSKKVFGKSNSNLRRGLRLSRYSKKNKDKDNK